MPHYLAKNILKNLINSIIVLTKRRHEFTLNCMSILKRIVFKFPSKFSYGIIHLLSI